MKRFSELYHEIDASNRTTVKVAALKRYFREVAPEEGAWAVFFLTGNRLKRPVRSRDFRDWAGQACGYPEWLVEECYNRVGDLAETLALLTAGRFEDEARPEDLPLNRIVETRIAPLREMGRDEQRESLWEMWRSLDAQSCLVFNKLITGGFRVGVSKTLVTRALAEVAGVEPAVMAHRLMGSWQPSAANYRGLFEGTKTGENPARPYPFCLAYPLQDEIGEDPAKKLGARDSWQIEWKWDGIRAQLIKRGGGIVLWSRGEEMVVEQFPEIAEAAARWEGSVVLDGEILVWDEEAELPAPFAQLQRRLGRKKVGAKLRKEAPAIFMAYDVLEFEGEDCREEGTRKRRSRMEAYVSRQESARLKVSPLVEARDWQTVTKLRDESRERRVEGLMLKKADAAYVAGRRKGEWWKWKVDPHTVDAVMVYAQQGHGRRAGLFTDYTFSVWSGDELVPFAKAYSGLSDAEIRQVDRWIRDHTLDKHGPVRVVEPQLVFEIAFENISRSKRHKSGIAVRFPRIRRWREDKLPAEADSLETVQALLH